MGKEAFPVQCNGALVRRKTESLRRIPNPILEDWKRFLKDVVSHMDHEALGGVSQINSRGEY